MRLIGLEPTRISTPDPKSGASTNFATGAGVETQSSLKDAAKVALFFYLAILYGLFLMKNSSMSAMACSMMVSLPLFQSAEVMFI